jgi:tetratricopeptide (TPR) repeat protein
MPVPYRAYSRWLDGIRTRLNRTEREAVRQQEATIRAAAATPLQAALDLAAYYERENLPLLAVAALDEALQIDQDNPALLERAGALFQSIGYNATATGIFEAAITAHNSLNTPNVVAIRELFDRRAVVLDQLGLLNEAALSRIAALHIR